MARIAEDGLGEALQVLGERESGTARLEEAVQAYRAALNIFDAVHAEYYRAEVQKNLDRVFPILNAKNSRR